MKDTIKLSMTRSVSVQDAPGRVIVTLKSFPLPDLDVEVTPEQAIAMGNALLRVAMQANQRAKA